MTRPTPEQRGHPGFVAFTIPRDECNLWAKRGFYQVHSNSPRILAWQVGTTGEERAGDFRRWTTHENSV